MARKKVKLPSPLLFDKASITALVVFVIFLSIFKVLSRLYSSNTIETSVSSIREVDNITKLIENRPNHLALIRCAPSDSNTTVNKSNWSACGVVGASPQYEQRMSLNPISFIDRLSSKFVDDNEVSHESQNWELVVLKFDDNSSKMTSADVVQAVSYWQANNKWVRDVEQQKLSKNSSIFRRFNIAFKRKNPDKGKSWLNLSNAYIDRRILKVQHGVPLFEANEETIEIASVETDNFPYSPQHYPIPKSLREYNSDNSQIFLHPEPPCEGSSRHALLVHEPHQRGYGESAFFFLLDYLQEQYPATFSKLHIFQEGQHNNLEFSDSVFKLQDYEPDNDIAKMLENSLSAWNSSFYAPLNDELISNEDAIQNFLVAKKLPKEGAWDEAVVFYSFQEESGALDRRCSNQGYTSTEN